MSFTVTRQADMLTPFGVQQPYQVEFSGPVGRFDSITAGIDGKRIVVGISSHPPSLAFPNCARVELTAASTRHLIGCLEQLAGRLEADGA